MITNPANQVGWPEVITKEVVENLHKFIANVYVTIGQTKGQDAPAAEAGGMLPSDGGSVESASDKENDGVSGNRRRDEPKKSRTRSISPGVRVVTWTRQIKGVLKTDPETALKEGNEPPVRSPRSSSGRIKRRT